MPDLTIPVGASFDILNIDTIRYDGNLYTVNGMLTLADGSTKSLGELLVEHGAPAYSWNELKRCFKIEAYDPDNNNAQYFTIYTSNSKQTGKNDVAKIPGGMWAEWYDFQHTGTGTGTTNGVVNLWNFYGQTFDSNWIGFKLNYGTSAVRSYQLTYQDDFLQESVPCPPVIVDATYMHDVKLHGIFQQTPVANGGHYYVPIRQLLLWRSVVGTDSSSTDYRRVPVYPVSDGYNSEGVVLEFNHDPGKFIQSLPDITKSYGYQILDDKRDEELLTDTLESQDFDPPPFRNALQLVGLWNGMMACHSGNTVLFCEPYRPHAWPQGYRYPLPYEIVSKAVDGNTLIVTTTGPAYLFSGAHPSSMTYEALPNTQAGKRADAMRGTIRTPGRAICVTPVGVCYATDDGIVASMGGRSQLLTDKLFTKEEWKQRYGTKFGRMRLAYSNGKLIGWFYATGETGFIMDLAGTSLTEWEPAPFVWTAAQMPGSEGLYLVANSGGTTVQLQRFEDPSARRMTATWLSKKVVLPAPVNFGCFQMVGSGQINVQINAGSRAVINITLASLVDGVPQVVRLPHGFREREWTARFLLSADAVLREFYLAGSPEELRDA